MRIPRQPRCTAATDRDWRSEALGGRPESDFGGTRKAADEQAAVHLCWHRLEQGLLVT
jgi:hypothetical protein